jgi:adenylate kinase family enzyme
MKSWNSCYREQVEKLKYVEVSQANFPELKGSPSGRGSPFNSARKDSLDHEFFLTRLEEYKENDEPLTKFRKKKKTAVILY